MLAALHRWKLRLIVVLALLGGPSIAWLGWSDMARIDRIVAQGLDGQARIVRLNRKGGGEGRASYTVDLAWQDASGQDRRADGVALFGGMAARLREGDRLRDQTVAIKYLPETPGRDGMLLTANVQDQLVVLRIMAWGGGALGLAGLLGCLWMFGIPRLPRTRPREEFVRDGRVRLGSGKP